MIFKPAVNCIQWKYVFYFLLFIDAYDMSETVPYQWNEGYIWNEMGEYAIIIMNYIKFIFMFKRVNDFDEAYK